MAELMNGQSLEGDAFTIILPTFEEADNIGSMVRTLRYMYPRARVMVVDDGSQDGTEDIVARMASTDPRVSLVQRGGGDKGLTASIVQGILSTRTDYFVVMDSDFQHPPSAVADIITAVREGNDMVIGVRRTRGKLDMTRRASSWGAHFLANSYLWSKGQGRCKDTMSGFFGGSTEVCANVLKEHFDQLERTGFKALFDLLKFLPPGSRIVEVEFDFGDRRGGESKLDSKVVLSIMRQCGVAGKAAAAITEFMFTHTLGRFVATLSLGLISTFAFLTLAHEAWDSSMTFSTVVAFSLAMVYLAIASELFFKKRREDSIVRGANLIFTGLVGYILNIYALYIFTSSLTTVQVISTFIGFAVAFSWDVVGCSFPSKYQRASL
jgi:dolichol-phosphate mannosyltransferase